MAGRDGHRHLAHRTLVAILLALPLILAFAPQDARAHGENSPLIQTVVDSVPGAPAVEAHTLPSQPLRIDVINRTSTTLDVQGYLGEPFLRIGPTGVYANLNSPTWYRSGNPNGEAPDHPASARRGAVPRWAQVSRRPEWGWFDFRIEPGKTRVPAQARTADRPIRLDSWSIPTRFGNQSGGIQGHVEFQPLVGNVVPTMTTPIALAPGVQVGLLPGNASGLFVTNTSSEPVTVIGKGGAPFARIDAHGVVVNVRSPTYADTVVASGGKPPPSDAQAPPRWRRVASVPQYGWVDYRLEYPRAAPPEIQRGGKRAVLSRWSVPVQVGNRRTSIVGNNSWVPFNTTGSPPRRGGALTGWVLVGVPAILAIALLGLGLRRRRATATPVGRPVRAA